MAQLRRSLEKREDVRRGPFSYEKWVPLKRYGCVRAGIGYKPLFSRAVRTELYRC
ncbi:hypothetical protein KDA_75330 [Dictyobacter alpinus]|uniref:Uncharacterized protein n=1 Tax=Dictyobacter alpinus TaxID=2014873 RepID=A0A402BL51_9CHLR|nr:hypothetical protein KDA_75330 [Dictyobacter alpinus]